ncbi:AAA family ATPase [Candidatus Halobeggiatoa sp. HSG11]|nr:AAA family ATPase [Candidatus Halobeggiatoa sp. HSG11]
MILTLKNIGIIKDTQIAFNGLTIIAGKNDTGKSTVGKLMFAIVKALSRFEQDLHEGQKKQIFEIIESIYFQVRRQYSFVENQYLKKEFHPPNFFNQIKDLLDNEEFEEIEIVLEDKINLLKNCLIESRSEFNEVQKIIYDIHKLKVLITKKEDKKSVITRALTKAFVSEFGFEITPKHSNLKSSIDFSEGANNIFAIELENNKITELELYDEVFFNDVTFIDAPILLQMYDVISSAKTLLEIINEDDKEQRLIKSSRPKVSLHIKDLISKLENAQYFSPDLFNQTFSQNINELIQGKFQFNKKQKDFLFKKAINQEQSIKLKSINTASGIKTFGILQLLMESDFIDERSLLIIDEPETHLHPQWQIEYAKLIVMLVAEYNIPVLLSSHSPYMIQALKVFSEKNNIQDKTKYYLAEETISNMTNIIDVTDDLNRIFKTLSEPLQELVWN